MKHRPQAREWQTKARTYWRERDHCGWTDRSKPGRPETNTSFNTPDIQRDRANTVQHRTDHSPWSWSEVSFVYQHFCWLLLLAPNFVFLDDNFPTRSKCSDRLKFREEQLPPILPMTPASNSFWLVVQVLYSVYLALAFRTWCVWYKKNDVLLYNNVASCEKCIHLLSI